MKMSIEVQFRKSIRDVNPIGSQVGPISYSLKLITFQLISIHLYKTSYLIYGCVKCIWNLFSSQLSILCGNSDILGPTWVPHTAQLSFF